MGSRIDSFVSVALALSAVGMCFVYGYRTFSVESPITVPSVSAQRVEDWDAVKSLGYAISEGDSSSSTLIVIGDLECPACRRFHSAVLAPLRESRGKNLEIVYVDYPLPYHKFAMPAARITACLSRIGRVSKWIDAIYANQDSLGLKPWSSYASDAGIRDTLLVNRCASGDSVPKNVTLAREFGKKLRVRGTPTILVNGWMFSHIPDRGELDSALAARRP